MSIENSQAILKYFIDLKSSVWFTLVSEEETLFCDHCGQTSFKFLAASAWNTLLREIHELRTLAQIKVRTFTYLVNMDGANHIFKINT